MSDYSERKRRRSRSLFGPIFLIAIGVYFLLNNMGVISSLNWWAALQLWPLLLIFLGINIIVQQAPRPFGSFLSGLVGITAVLVFGYVLFFGGSNPLLERLNVSTARSAEIKTETISFAPTNVETAVVSLELGSAGANVYALEDSNSLIEGTVNYVGDLHFDTDVNGSRATVSLDERASGIWFLNPTNWVNVGDIDAWQIGLSPGVTTDLTVDSGSGAIQLDLVGLALSDLRVDTGSGAVQMTLPGGDYDANIDTGSGAISMTLPGNGRQEIVIDSGSGAVSMTLPTNMEARVDFDGGSGRFRPGARFQLIDGERDGDGVWETEGYDENDANSISLVIDSGSGSVTIESAQGR